MKRLLIVCLLFCSLIVFADNENINVVGVRGTETRSLVNLPEASIDTKTKILSVSYDHSGTFYLYVLNNMSETVYQSVLPANGLQYHYDLSGIGEGYFRLVIEGASGEYEGFFSLTR